MATTSEPTTPPKKNYINPDEKHDELRRHLKRTLPVKLTREEQTDIAIAASKKRMAVKQLEKDLDDEKKRRQAQINELQREVDVSDRELASGWQDRIVSCSEIFRAGMVLTVRTDEWEIIEQRPATAQEAQRFLPAVEAVPTNGAGAPLLDQAAAAQQAAASALGAAAAPHDDDSDDDSDDTPEDDGLNELTPAQKAAKEAAAARAARRNGGGTKGKGKS